MLPSIHPRPHLDAELLSNNHLACDGSFIESSGFSYAVTELSAASLRQQLDVYIEQQLFPPLEALYPAGKSAS